MTASAGKAYPDFPRPRRAVWLPLLLLSGILISADGCQRPKEVLSPAARILLDSLIAADELMFDSASANLGFDRMNCLLDRAYPVLGLDPTYELGAKAEMQVRRRHSEVDLQRGIGGIEKFHPAGDERFCQRVDSLWYARAVKP